MGNDQINQINQINEIIEGVFKVKIKSFIYKCPVNKKQ